MRKKAWATPVLTVLVKGKPEERVLAHCKGSSVSAPGVAVANCHDPTLSGTGGIGCWVCLTMGMS